MADKKDDDTGRKDADDQNDDGTDDGDDDDDDTDDEEKGWARLGDIVDKAVEKRLGEWSAQQAKKTISSRSPRKPEKKTTRKQGFFSSQFFSGLNDQE